MPHKLKEITQLEGTKVERIKMPRINRAAQFAPFNALRGLSHALKMKEYEQEKRVKGDLAEEQIIKISACILSLSKNDIVFLKYFKDGYEKTITGKAKLFVEDQYLVIENETVKFDNIIDIDKLS